MKGTKTGVTSVNRHRFHSMRLSASMVLAPLYLEGRDRDNDKDKNKGASSSFSVEFLWAGVWGIAEIAPGPESDGPAWAKALTGSTTMP